MELLTKVVRPHPHSVLKLILFAVNITRLHVQRYYPQSHTHLPLSLLHRSCLDLPGTRFSRTSSLHACQRDPPYRTGVNPDQRRIRLTKQVLHHGQEDCTVCRPVSKCADCLHVVEENSMKLVILSMRCMPGKSMAITRGV